jgi:glycine/D-amino acid oxidase-like deaminating enzyme/nitrite reductase/ring-hydroxylating ferredoxin subunit
MSDAFARAGQNPSIWEATVGSQKLNPLLEDTSADVCIVGAGIAGMSTAYLLVREGKSVTVLDDGLVGSGMTGRTTAHLVNVLDDRYYDLERYHGTTGARLAAESHTAAIEKIEQIARDEGMNCEFARVDGYLFLPPGGSNDELNRELEAATRAGLQVEHVSRAPLETFDTGPCLRFPNQAQFHPLAYLHGLHDAILRNGGRIFTGSHVKKVAGGKAAHVETSDGHVVNAHAVVVATNTPVNDLFAIHTKQAPYTTYAIGLEIPRGAVPSALYWDTAQSASMESRLGPAPYHYVRLAKHATDPEAEILISGGEDHKTGQTTDFEDRFARLERWTRERFPRAGRLLHRWSGQVMEPIDGLAFIGRNPADEPNVFIATGDSGNGMTHGMIAGLLITDLVQGRENPWAKLYDPSRKPVRAGAEFAKENLNVVTQFADYLKGGDISSPDELPPGQGAILRRGLHKIAAFRDEAGTLHEFSAVCPHLKCIVRWNTAEKTWDCPCHGSRFDSLGHVLNGPAVSNLAKLRNSHPVNSAR